MSDERAEQDWPTMQSVEFSTPEDAKLARKLASEIQNMWLIECDKRVEASARATRERIAKELEDRIWWTTHEAFCECVACATYENFGKKLAKAVRDAH